MTLRVSIQQAAANALAGHIGQILTDVTVEARWPSPDKEKPAKSITVVTAGERQDTAILRLLSSSSNSPAAGATTKWQVQACKQLFQLDIWAQSDVERDDIIARLDEALNAGESALTGVYNPDPVGNGVLLLLGDGWTDSTADFVFSGPDLEDLPDTTGRNVFRATYRGESNFMLSVTKATARQRAVSFLAALSETDSYPPRDTYTP